MNDICVFNNTPFVVFGDNGLELCGFYTHKITAKRRFIARV